MNIAVNLYTKILAAFITAKRPIRMTKRALIVLAFILAVFCIFFIFLYADSRHKYDSIRSYAALVEAKNLQLETDMNERFNMFYEQKLLKLLGKEKLTVLTKDLWNYSLRVNGEQLKGKTVYIPDTDIELKLSESLIDDMDLPGRILRFGSVTGGDDKDDMAEHIVIKTTLPFNRNVKLGERFSTAEFFFDDVPKGSIIGVSLSEPLKERLKLTDSYFEIIRK